MENQAYQTDVVIIGAGPVGLFAIFECGMLGLKTHIVDSLDDIGGQCTALYPEKPIYDIPAYPKLLAGDLIKNLEEQASPFDPTYHLGQQVSALTKLDDEFLLITSKNVHIKTKAVIIAAGAGAFGPNRPPLKNIEQYEGSGVFYYVKDPKKFADKNIVIAGGGDSAVDWAIYLSDIARNVTLVHRRDKFRAAPDNVEKLRELFKQEKIDLKTGWQMHDLNGKDTQLESMTIIDFEQNKHNIPCDVLLPFFGLATNLGPIKEWELDIENNHIKVDPLTQQTSTKGIFAIGDICDYPHKLKLILNGFGEGATAAHQIREMIYPDQDFHFEYSTTKGVPN